MITNNSNIIANLALICMLLFPMNAEADQSIKVRDDFGVGIKSNLYISLGNDVDEKGVTDDSGNLNLETPCKRGKQLNAKPLSPLYYKGQVDCRPGNSSLVIRVTKKAFVQNLIWNAEKFEASGKSGNAALVYSELAVRLHTLNARQASLARKKAYVTFADAMELPEGVTVIKLDKVQNTTVLTADFVHSLKEYQRRNKIPVTGAIDYRTLATQSDVTIAEVLSKRIDQNLPINPHN